VEKDRVAAAFKASGCWTSGVSSPHRFATQGMADMGADS